jgi:hypothetical protein
MKMTIVLSVRRRRSSASRIRPTFASRKLIDALYALMVSLCPRSLTSQCGGVVNHAAVGAPESGDGAGAEIPSSGYKSKYLRGAMNGQCGR